MSKYDLLKEHLQNRTDHLWRARFWEIEKILRCQLPASARKYPAWWANEKNGPHVHSHSWQDADWETNDLNLTGEAVTFRKIK